MRRVVGAGVHVAVLQSSDDGGPAGRGRGDAGDLLGGVYRTRLRNVVLAGALMGLAAIGCSTLTGDYPAFVWSRRIPIAVVLASVPIVRVLRRAVIVSPFGLEARRTFVTWRVPWSVVESFAVGRPPSPSRSEGVLTVVLIDGSTRSARVGPGRHGQRDFAEVASAAKRRPQVRDRGYLGPNWPLVVFILGGAGLIVACAAADSGRIQHHLRRTGEVSSTTERLRELERQIATGDRFAEALYVIVVGTGVAAAVWSRRSRGVAPTGPWPARLRLPDGNVPGASWPPPQATSSRRRSFDIPSLVTCRDDGVFNHDGIMMAAISDRVVAWTKIRMYTYWSAGGVAAFSVQVGTPTVVGAASEPLSPGTRWLLTSWETPLPAYLEVATDPFALNLYTGAKPTTVSTSRHPSPHDTTMCRLVAKGPARTGYTAVDEHDRALATIERSSRGWECKMSPDLTMTMRRLVCVAAVWAERRWLISD